MSTTEVLTRGRLRIRTRETGVVPTSLGLTGATATAAVLVVAAAVGFLSVHAAPILLLGGVVMLCVVALAVRAPRSVALGTLFSLPFLGLLRRAAGSYLSSLDPLTFAGPALAVICLAVLTFGKRAGPRTPLAAVVSAMVLLGALQIFNPAQGGPVVGLMGAGLFVGPMVWFFIGHRVGDAATLALVTKVLGVIAVVVALYGLKQVLFGFSAFEERWIAAKQGQYAALNIGGHIRPFATFASGAEYSYFLALGAVLFATRSSAMGLKRTTVVLLFLVASFYAGSRGLFLAAVLGTAAVALVQRVRNLTKALVLTVSIGVVAILLLSLLPVSGDDTTAGVIRVRTLSGLSRPFDPEVSTLGIHIDVFRRGVASGLSSPLGSGAAAVNLAGATLSGASLNAEHDIPNVLLAYGWAGGLLLMLLILRIYRVVRSVVRERRRSSLGPAVFILLVFGVWFAGELYAVTAIMWFFLGALDRPDDDAPSEPVEPPMPDVRAQFSVL